MNYVYYKKFSEEELRKFKYTNNDYYWISISEYQNLSENFIQDFQDKVNWNILNG